MDIRCTWKSDNGSDISSILTVVENLPSENTNDIYDLLDEEKCISLSNISSSNDCECSISLDLSTCEFYIPDLLVLSEAKYIEVYTKNQEYFKTFHSSLISAFEDSKICKTLISFSKPEKVFILKFKGLFCEGTLWIYGIYAKLKKILCKKSLRSTEGAKSILDQSNELDYILRDKNIILSDKAKEFKKLYEMCNQKKNSEFAKNMPFNLQSLLMLNKGLNRLDSKDQESNSKETKTEHNITEHPVFDTHCDIMENLTQRVKKSVSLTSHEPPTMEQFMTYTPNEILNILGGINSHETNKHLQNRDAETAGSSMVPHVQQDISVAQLHEQSNLYNIVESIVDKKFKELETKMKMQIEESNRSIMNKLAAIENLLINNAK